MAYGCSSRKISSLTPNRVMDDVYLQKGVALQLAQIYRLESLYIFYIFRQLRSFTSVHTFKRYSCTRIIYPATTFSSSLNNNSTDNEQIHSPLNKHYLHLSLMSVS